MLLPLRHILRRIAGGLDLRGHDAPILLGVVFAPIICARREADLSLIEAVELGAVAGLALIYPFYILCSTLEKEGTLKKYAPDQKRKASHETEE